MLISTWFYRYHKSYKSKYGGCIVELESRWPPSWFISLFGFKGRMGHYTCIAGDPMSGNSTEWACSNGGKVSYFPSYDLTAMWRAAHLKGEVENWEEKNLTKEDKVVKDIIT